MCFLECEWNLTQVRLSTNRHELFEHTVPDGLGKEGGGGYNFRNIRDTEIKFGRIGKNLKRINLMQCDWHMTSSLHYIQVKLAKLVVCMRTWFWTNR